MPSSSSHSEDRRQVLLAHDSPTIARVITRILSRLGADVLHVRTSGEFSDIIHKYTWSLAIIAWHFDGTMGTVLCETLREHWNSASVPIIIIGSLSDESMQTKAYEAGADFFMTLPLDPLWTPKIFDRYLSNRHCIVAADDSATIRLQLTTLLKKDGYWLIPAKDGVEAWNYIRRFVPDVILLDIQMPGMDGYTLCEEIRKNPITRHIPVVFISSQDSPADLDRSFNVGATEFLTKPIDETDLRQLLKRIFSGIHMRGRDRILVIDDSPTILGMLRYGLGQQGFQIVTARNGEEGLRKALRFRPTVVISDWQMPRMTGTELTRKLREHKETKDAAIILLSSKSTRADAIRGLREGADEYISKPFNFERLIATVERLVAERQLKREREVLRTYLPSTVRQLAEKLAPGNSDLTELHADERILTVMFLDIVGFTQLCENRSPKHVVSLLNQFYETMAEEIVKHQGVIDKFIGDAILALFGFSEEDYGVYHALQASKGMLKAAQHFVPRVFNMPKISIRIGINTGPLIYGDLGAKNVRRDFTVIGDAVNVAQRLESMARPGHVTVSEESMQYLKNPSIKKRAEEFFWELKGRAQKVRGYMLGVEDL